MLIGRNWRPAVLLAAVMIATAGCAASSPTPSAFPSDAVVVPTATATRSSAPTITPERTPEATTEPTPTPEPTEPPQPDPTPIPTPRPVQAAGWTSPQVALRSSECASIDLLVDSSGGEHLVADCGDSVHYAASQRGGGWSDIIFGRAGGLVDRNPLLALDADRLYAAYSQAVEQGGCGGGWFTKVGVFVRSRVLPNGAWSAAQRIGPPGDQLDSFAVHGGVMDLVVTTLDQKTYLETAGGGTVRRYALAGDQGSVAVAPDGQVGVAYLSGTAVRYGTLAGSTLHSIALPGVPSQDGITSGPRLVFDAAGHAHVSYTFTEAPGCASGNLPAQAGTYYATDAGGAWTDRRITTDEGTAALALDASGRADVLIDGTAGEALWGSLSLYGSVDGRSWKRTELVSQQTVLSALAVDPTTGRPVVAFRDPSDGNTDAIAVIAQR